MSIEQLFENKNRPLPITILGWFLIFTGLISLYTLHSVFNPEVMNVWAHMGINPVIAITINTVNGIVNTAIGYGFLNRQKWSKNLYLVYTPIVMLISAILLKSEFSLLISGILIYLLYSYLLFLPSSKAFFNGTYTESEKSQKIKAIRISQQRKSWVAKAFGIFFANCSGWLLIVMLVTLFTIDQSLYVIATIMFSILIILFYILSCVLWGWERWIAILGWTLSSFGALAVFTGLSIALLSKTMTWELTDAANVDLHIFNIIGLAGLFPLGIGALLVYLQFTIDSESAELLD